MNQNIPSKNIDVNTPHSFFNPKIQEVCIGHTFDDGSMTYIDNRVLWTLIEEVLKNGGLAATLSRTQIMLQNLSITNVCTITRTTQRLERWGLITVTRGQYDKSQRMWMPNTYSVNWETLVREFGHVVDQLKGRLWDFLVKMKERILGFYRDGVSNTASDALCNTLKTPPGTKEEKTISIVATAPLDIAKEKKEGKVFASCFAKGRIFKKKFALKRKEESPAMIIDSEASTVLKAQDPMKRCAFDITMRECPETYRAIALKEGIHADWVDEEYEEFFRYWAPIGKTTRGKKSDWPGTWRNWVRKNLNDFRVKYKLVPRKPESQLSGNSGQLFGNSEQLNYPEEVRGMVRKVKDRVTEPLFKSWLSECIFEREGDSYTFIVPKRLGRYKQDSIKTRFDEILMDELKMTVIYET